MLWILLIISVVFIALGAMLHRNDVFAIIGVTGIISLLIVGLITIITLGCYNNTKSTASERLSVLQEQNEIVIKQIEPIVANYSEFEKSTYNDMKMTPEVVVAFCSMYPELKTNELVKRQIDIILKNQDEIKSIKLEIAGLNAYHMWIWTDKQ